MRWLACAACVVTFYAQASNVGLIWDSVTDPRVTAYEVGIGTAPGVYSSYQSVPIPQSQAVIQAETNTYFSVRSVGGGLYSDWSNEVLWLAQTQPLPQVGLWARYELEGTSMASDDFTDSDGTALADHDSNWSAGPYGSISNLEIDNNNLVVTAAWSDGSAFYDTGHDADQESQAVIVGDSDGRDDRHVNVRMSATSQGYSANLGAVSGGNFTRVYLTKNGSYLATLGDVLSAPIADDHTIRLTVSGTSSTVLRAYLDGVEIGSGITDASSPITSGDPGVRLYGAGRIDSNRMDDWTDNEGGAAAASLFRSNKIASQHILVR